MYAVMSSLTCRGNEPKPPEILVRRDYNGLVDGLVHKRAFLECLVGNIFGDCILLVVANQQKTPQSISTIL
jgi:hypothetical protein